MNFFHSKVHFEEFFCIYTNKEYLGKVVKLYKKEYFDKFYQEKFYDKYIYITCIT